METNQNKHQGIALILSGSLLFLFWTLFALFIPMTEPYIKWVLDEDWIWINAIGFSGSMIGIFAITNLKSLVQKSRMANLFFILSISGIVILSSILFFEAFILKGIARLAPEIVVLNEGYYIEPSFYGINLLGGLSFSGGVIGIASLLFRQGAIKKWKLITLMISCPLFGIVIMPPNLRLLGVLLYFISFLLIGVEIQRIKDSTIN